MKAGENTEFSYTGAPQEFIVPVNGIYKVECWGAQGGNYSSYIGGKGGYASGNVTLKKGTPLYCNVGGTTTTVEGGWNGGGKGMSNGRGGGGATDIRLEENSLYSRIIVAGGGGGSGVAYGGGVGGGVTGGDGYTSLNRSGTGGTQTEGGKTYSNITAHYGSFGIGGSLVQGYSAGGGGGGWYGGGGAYDNDSDSDGRGGGGGSAYVLTEPSYKPDGYTPTEEYYFSNTSILDGNSTMPSPTGTGTQTGNTGNGLIRITLIESLGSNLEMKCNIKGQMRDVDTMLVKVNGTWREVEQIIGKKNGSWTNPSSSGGSGGSGLPSIEAGETIIVQGVAEGFVQNSFVEVLSMYTPYKGGTVRGEVTVQLWNGSGSIFVRMESKNSKGDVVVASDIEVSDSGQQTVNKDIPVYPNGSVIIYVRGTASTSGQGVKYTSPKFKKK